MKIRNNNPLDLEGMDGEIITVLVQSTQTVHAVVQNLDGTGSVLAQNTLLTFPLNKVLHDPSILLLFFTFSNPNGGRYDITVTGSMGGISIYAVGQLHGEAANAIAYTFDVI